MFTKQIGNVNYTIDFKPLIIVIVIAFVGYIIRAIQLLYREKKLNKYLYSGEYSRVIILGEKLLKVHSNYAKRFKHPNTIARIEYLNFAIAVSNFAEKNDEQFLSHINAITQLNDHREIWLALFYLRKDDFENAELHYNKININDETYVARTFLEAWKYDKQGEHDLAKEKINSIYADLKHIVLKHIADEILS